MRAIVLTAALLACSVAHADYTPTEWDAKILQKCSSAEYYACSIKSGGRICSRDQSFCLVVQDMTPATVLRRSPGFWWVRTGIGDGWVPEQWMMYDGAD